MAKKRSEIADVDRSLYDFRFSDADAEKLLTAESVVFTHCPPLPEER